MAKPFGSAVFTKGSIAAASTTDVFAGTKFWTAITAGAGPIESFGTAPNRWRLVTFETNVTVTNDAVTLQLPGNVDKPMKIGDSMLLKSDADGNAICTHLQRKNAVDAIVDLDADLAAIAALISAADTMPYATGPQAWALTSLTAAARTVLDDATVAAMLATLGGAPLASPTFTGAPQVPAGSVGTPGLGVGGFGGIYAISGTFSITPDLAKHVDFTTSGMAHEIPGGGNVWTITGESTTGYAAKAFIGSSVAPTLTLSKGRGTIAVPVVVNQNDVLGDFSCAGYDGAALRTGVRTRAQVIETTPGAAAFGSAWIVSVVAIGAAAVSEGLRYDQTSGLQIGGAGNIVIGQDRISRDRVYTVATLPTAGTAGRNAFASNCRVFNGAGVQEGAGVGTGGLVNDNGTAWKIAGTNITAVA